MLVFGRPNFDLISFFESFRTTIRSPVVRVDRAGIMKLLKSVCLITRPEALQVLLLV